MKIYKNDKYVVIIFNVAIQEVNECVEEKLLSYLPEKKIEVLRAKRVAV